MTERNPPLRTAGQVVGMTTNGHKPQTAWQMAADDVIAVCLNQNDHYERARFVMSLRELDFPPGNWRGVYRAICTLKDTGKPLHDTFIAEHVPGLDIPWLMQRMALDDPLRRETVFTENVNLLKRRGAEYAMYEALQTSLAELRTEKTDVDSIVAKVLQVAALGNRQDSGSETAKVHIKKFKEYINAETVPAPLCGISWLDQNSGGFQSGRGWMIGAPYKQRKTTLAINLLVGLMLRNPDLSVAFLSFEMLQKSVTASILAILAAYHYRSQGLNSSAGSYLSMDNILGAKKAYVRWPADLPQSMDWAYATYEKIEERLRIYDVSDEAGSLIDIASMRRNILRDKALYGGQFFFIDHLQEVKSPGNDYERVSAVSGEISHLTKHEDIVTITLTQLNELTVKSSSEDEHSPGAKGGGTPAEKADYFIRARYLSNEPNFLTLKMQLSRYGAMGQSTKQQLQIHPASGLLLDNQWGKV